MVDESEPVLKSILRSSKNLEPIDNNSVKKYIDDFLDNTSKRFKSNEDKNFTDKINT